MGASKAKIKVQKDGPYLGTGNVPMHEMTISADEEGFSKDWLDGKEYPLRENCILCRCGKSKNKPYCDGTHAS